MKKLLGPAVLILTALFIASCGTPVKKEASTTASSAATETAAKKTAAMNPANGIVIANFEYDSPQVTTYQGPQSKVSAVYIKDIVNKGKQSLHVMNDTKDWGGALLGLSDELADWSAYNTYKMWVYGKNSGCGFTITLEETKDLELWVYPVVDNWKGWKQIIIPLKSFTERADWQPDKAVKNGKIDYPLKSFQFCTTANGTFDLYFGQIEVTKE